MWRRGKEGRSTTGTKGKVTLLPSSVFQVGVWFGGVRGRVDVSKTPETIVRTCSCRRDKHVSYGRSKGLSSRRKIVNRVERGGSSYKESEI